MSKISTSLAVMLCLLSAVPAFGQDSTYNFTVQTLGGYTTPGVVPFWLRSNQFGSIPLDGASLSFIGAARKDYDLSGDKLFDWGASLEGRANLGQGSNLTLIEGYGKVRLGIFELRAGRSKKITGLCDTTLSSGSFSISGHNLGIPEIELSVPEYWTLPILGELFAFKGNLSHGWMGDVYMSAFRSTDTLLVENYLHQKSLYGRFGKTGWKFKLYGGFNHQVLWCSGEEHYGSDYELTQLDTYLYILSGKRYTNERIDSERLGNHIGSIDIGVEYTIKQAKVLLYRQNFYEAGALAHLANIQDGLNGMSLENLKESDAYWKWERFNFEFLYTKNQAGEPWSPDTPSPYESYYNHGQYIQGWSYGGVGLGTPFITSIIDAREGLPAGPRYFINNRVVAFNMAGQGVFNETRCLLRLSYSRNYGTYYTTDEEQSTDLDDAGEYGIFGQKEQLSTYLGLSRELKNGLIVDLIAAADYGKLLYNSFGIFLKASYTFEK